MTYTQFPGWDLLATNPGTGRTCRVQVKARLRTDYGGAFPIKNFDAEFVVRVALMRNRAPLVRRPPWANHRPGGTTRHGESLQDAGNVNLCRASGVIRRIGVKENSLRWSQ